MLALMTCPEQSSCFDPRPTQITHFNQAQEMAQFRLIVSHQRHLRLHPTPRKKGRSFELGTLNQHWSCKKTHPNQQNYALARVQREEAVISA